MGPPADFLPMGRKFSIFFDGNSMDLASIPSVIMSNGVGSVSSWLAEINNSKLWQDRIFYALSGLYAIVAVAALLQLFRVQQRLPDYGWTKQKVFLFLNFLVNLVRSIVFIFRRNVQQIKPEIIQHLLFDLPGLAFFTTFVLLVLHWAEIYYKANGKFANGLRPTFYKINAAVYSAQIALWLLSWWNPSQVILSKIFFEGVSLLAAYGFLVYGRRLYVILQQFPIKSKAQQKKLHEVFSVAVVCFLCFLDRFIMICLSASNKNADLDALNQPVLNFIYYVIVEIVPTLLVLFILKKLPRKRAVAQYPSIQ